MMLENNIYLEYIPIDTLWEIFEFGRACRHFYIAILLITTAQ